MKKSTIIFIFVCFTSSIFGMKPSFRDTIVKEMEKSKATRGEEVFNEFLSYINENKEEKDQIIERVTANVTDFCFYKAKNSLEEINSALAVCLSKLGSSLFLNVENAEKKRNEIKKIVSCMLNKAAEEKDSLDHFMEYKKLFKEKLFVFDQETAKDILCMSVHIAKENKDDFKNVLGYALRWAINWDWVKNLIYGMLVKQVASIEKKINEADEKRYA